MQYITYYIKGIISFAKKEKKRFHYLKSSLVPMKKSFLLFFLLSLVGFIQSKAEIVVLNPNMTETQALATPYTLSKTIDPNTNTITLQFDLNVIEFSDDPVQIGKKICSVPGLNTTQEVGLPIVPEYQCKYQLPTVDSVQVAFSVTSTKTFNYTLAIGNNFVTGDQYNDWEVNPVPITGSYPPKHAFQSDLQFYRGKPVHYFNICPVVYTPNSANAKVRVATSMTVTITFDKNVSDLEPDRHPSFVAERVNRLEETTEGSDWFTSGDDLYEYPKETTEDYLIISSKVFEKEVGEFAEWKKTLGYRVHSSLKWMWTTQEIRDTIKSYYDNVPNLNYVLFVGPHSTIPGLPFTEFSSYFVHDPRIKKDAITYSGYALMDGRGDIIPEFNVGFVYTLTADQTNTVFKKFINYEKDPVTDYKFYQNAFFAGRFDYQGSDNGEPYGGYSPVIMNKEDLGFIGWLEYLRPNLASRGINVKRIYARRIKNGNDTIYPEYWANGTYKSFDNYAIPEYLRYPNFLWDSTKEDMTKSLSDGCFFGAYYSHGNCDSFSSIDFEYEDYVKANVGKKRPVIVTLGCGNAQNQWNGTIVHKLLRDSDGPVALFASSEVSVIKTNQYLLEGLINYMWPKLNSETKAVKSYQMGKWLNAAMSSGEKKCNDFGLNQFQRLTYCTYGDPSMDFTTASPESIENYNLYSYGASVFVDLKKGINPEQNFKINFYEKETGRVESYLYRGPDFYFEASPNATNVQVSFTAHNYIPLIDNVQVNDGESYYPRAKGYISDISYNRAQGIISVDLTFPKWVQDCTLTYAGFDKTSEYQSYNGVLNVDQNTRHFDINVGSDIKGIFEFKLIYDNILLDSKRVLVK
ncbi:MAG: hypothetical protein HDT07_06285 [Bacteroidales bacterium]|nr:hypothetical protein [Bacteroidales bacterium]